AGRPRASRLSSWWSRARRSRHRPASTTDRPEAARSRPAAPTGPAAAAARGGPARAPRRCVRRRSPGPAHGCQPGRSPRATAVSLATLLEAGRGCRQRPDVARTYGEGMRTGAFTHGHVGKALSRRQEIMWLNAWKHAL